MIFFKTEWLSERVKINSSWKFQPISRSFSKLMFHKKQSVTQIICPSKRPSNDLQNNLQSSSRPWFTSSGNFIPSTATRASQFNNKWGLARPRMVLQSLARSSKLCPADLKPINIYCQVRFKQLIKRNNPEWYQYCLSQCLILARSGCATVQGPPYQAKETFFACGGFHWTCGKTCGPPPSRPTLQWGFYLLNPSLATPVFRNVLFATWEEVVQKSIVKHLTRTSVIRPRCKLLRNYKLL